MPPRSKVSAIWRYFTETADKKSATCNSCKNTLRIYNGSTGNLSRHLRAKHRKTSTEAKRQPAVRQGILSGYDAAPQPQSSASSQQPSSIQPVIVTRPSNKKLRKPLPRGDQEEYGAFDTSDDIQVKPTITKVSQPRFALSWESYQNRLCSKLNTLLVNEDFVDLTLAAGGHLVKVHQLIMSIASPYLKEIIHSSPARHPIIFLTNISYPTLKNLLQYVYTGQVDITEDELEPFFAAAKALQIQGIDSQIDTDILKSQADGMIGEALTLPPDPNESVAEGYDANDDDFDESQILIIPRSATTRTSNSPNTERILFKRQPAHCTSPIKKKLFAQIEEMEPENLGDVMMDEDMVIVPDEDIPCKADPIAYYEVSRTDDPDPLNTPSPKNAETVTVQTMVLNRYKYTLVKTSEDGVRKWRCIDHLKHGCKARTVTNGNTVVERSQTHNHPHHDKK